MKGRHIDNVLAGQQLPVLDPETLWVDAIYRARPEDLGVNNPLIRALPLVVNEDDVLKEFRNAPHFEKSQRVMEKSVRIQLIGSLSLYLETLPCHVALIESVFRVIIQGYTWRNPFVDVQKTVKHHYALSMEGKQVVPIVPMKPSHSAGIALFGISGIGKSTSILRTLSFFPQVIRHPVLNRSNLQVVWLKVDCPPDGSINQLFHWILKEYDFLLNTGYADEVGANARLDSLINKVASVASHHHTGMVVIDEVQFAATGAARRGDILMDFFVSFSNVVGVPLFIAGTPKALSLFEKSFLVARRTCDHGAIIYTNFAFGEDWNYFLSNLFEYQWVKNPVKLNDELSVALHELTQGIHSLVVRLFQLAQIIAIREESEKITPALLKRIAKERFGPVQPIMEALRSKKKNRIELYDDLLVETLSGLSAEVTREAQISKISVATETRQKNSSRLSTISSLMAVGIPQALARKTVLQISGEFPDLSGVELLREAVLQATEARETHLDSQTPDSSTLNEIVCKASTAEEALNALRKAGLLTGENR